MGQARSFLLFRKSAKTGSHSNGADLIRFTLTRDLIDESKVYDPCNAIAQTKENSFQISCLNSPSHGQEDQERSSKENYEKKIAVLQEEVQHVRAEYDRLIARLSEISAVRLTQINPQIADLSDPNRPSQLVEQFTDVYNSEWTDAFEYLSEVKGLENSTIVIELLNILKTIYNVCLESIRKPSEQLRKAILAYLGLSDENKHVLVIKKTENMLREYRAKQFEVLLGHVIKDITEQLNNQLEDNVNDTLDKYVQKCIRLCWFMCVTDPQMHLDFGEQKMDMTQGDNASELLLRFDADKFVSYLEQGMYMEFVVWPAVYLYKGGPLIKKGIRHGSNSNTDAT